MSYTHRPNMMAPSKNTQELNARRGVICAQCLGRKLEIAIFAGQSEDRRGGLAITPDIVRPGKKLYMQECLWSLRRGWGLACSTGLLCT